MNISANINNVIHNPQGSLTLKTPRKRFDSLMHTLRKSHGLLNIQAKELLRIRKSKMLHKKNAKMWKILFMYTA